MTTLNLRRIVYELARPEGRMVGTRGHDRARTMLVRELADLGLQRYAGDSYELPYQHEGQSFTNLAGVLPGRNPKKAPVLIGAHYDSVIEGCCADDNAAAVAIGLEAIRQLRDCPPSRPVVLALFDAEEPPHFQTAAMGSNWFYRHQRARRGIHAAIVMDLVGHDIQVPGDILPKSWLNRLPWLRGREVKIPRLRHLLFMTGAESHPALGPLVEETGMPERLLLMMTPNRNVGDMSDHGVFRENGVPYLFLSCGHWIHYHTKTDTPDRLSYEKMDRIARYVVSLVTAMADAGLPRTKKAESDTVQQEIRCIRKAFGMTLPAFLRMLGIRQLEDRSDLDALAAKLIDLGV